MSSFVDDYFTSLFEWSPSTATATGFHEYDSKIEDLSAAATNARISRLKELKTELGRVGSGNLTADEAIDADILDSQINAELFDLETIRTWRHNPMNYVGLPGSAVDNLIKRNFAPPPERLRSVTARLKGVPAIMSAMKANIENPPHEFTDLAFRIAHGSVGFFKGDVAMWAKDAAGGNAALLNEFNQANEAAVASLEDASGWLEKTLLPKSTGSYAIGPENFSRKLLYEEMVDTPLDRLLAIGEANLEKDYDAFIETARQIDPSKAPTEVMKSLSNEHPAESSLISDARRTVEGIIQFIRDRKIITIPSEIRPIITETPPYARSGTFASMDTPGAYEAKATEAFYYITPPEREWDANHKEEHLRLFNSPVMNVITIHEAYPGHYIQFLNVREFPTKTRKILYCSSNVEGWAHYSEQMMIDEGFGGGDPRIRLAQLEEALLRDVRYVVGIKLHTAGWTVEQGAKFFEMKAFQEPANAYEEARRGAYNPTYLYYTLGKLQIYKLREDYRNARGPGYSLANFHNEFVRQGGIPIKLIRRIMLPGDNGPAL
jgi:uncharacterized protein (DUF885 family)